jgi:hypothetical protein
LILRGALKVAKFGSSLSESKAMETVKVFAEGKVEVSSAQNRIRVQIMPSALGPGPWPLRAEAVRTKKDPLIGSSADSVTIYNIFKVPCDLGYFPMSNRYISLKGALSSSQQKLV